VLEAFAQFDVQGTGFMDADHLHTLLVKLHIPLTETLPDAPRLQHLREHLLTMPGSYRSPKVALATTINASATMGTAVTAGAAAAADTAAGTAATAVGGSMRGTTAAGAAATALLPRASMKATSAQPRSPRRVLNDTADTTTTAATTAAAAAAANGGDNSTDMFSDVDGDVSLVTVTSETASGTAADGNSSKHMRSRVSRRYPGSDNGSSTRGALHAPTLLSSQNGAIVQQQGRTVTGRSSVLLSTAIGISDYVAEDTASAAVVKKQDWAIAASAALTHGDSSVDKIR
jgi:trimeric autotransporter adhesin